MWSPGACPTAWPQNARKGTWQHVVLTGNNDSFVLYVDGHRDAEGALAAEADPKDFVVRIGYTNDDFPSPTGFDGDLDDLRLYCKQLTPEQIHALSSNPEAVEETALVGCWPFDTDGKWVQDTRGPLFIDPYPLTDKLFLVSQNADREWNEFDAWDLYLLDETGATLLIHDEPEISCYQPMPLRPRTCPPILTGARDEQLAQENLAEVIVTDVYHGLDGIARGAARYIRINEQVPRPWAARRNWEGDVYDQQHACITKDTPLPEDAR